MNKRKIIDLAFSIPGLYDKKDAYLLLETARQGGDIVELGCYKGRTTALLVQASKDGRVTSVDPFIEPSHRYEASSPDVWRNNLKKIGLEPPQLLHMTGDEALKHFQGKWLSLVFIDAAHDYESVLNDLHNWTPLVKKGGFVALHDMYHPHFHGVSQAVTEWFAEQTKFRFYDQVGLTIAFERRHE